MPKNKEDNLARRARTSSGLSQQEFCRKYLIPKGTFLGWERGEREPDRAAAAYLRLIEQHPLVIASLIEALPSA